MRPTSSILTLLFIVYKLRTNGTLALVKTLPKTLKLPLPKPANIVFVIN